MSWLDYLQPASWRGVPFVVRESEIVRGRRVAVHEYPHGDKVWVEDLGRGTRSYSFTGFLVGDDVFIQQKSMLDAAEKEGPGTLVHPSLGTLSVSLVEPIVVRQEVRGRTVSITFSFIEGQAAPLYPSIVSKALNAIGDWADNALKSVGIDFATDIEQPLQQGAQLLQQGAAVAQGALTAVQGFAATAGRLVGDASLITGGVVGLPGNLGRFANGALSIAQAPTATVESVMSGITTARTAVNDAATEASTLANLL